MTTDRDRHAPLAVITKRTVFGASTAAALLSFVSLVWVGQQVGLHPALALLLPACVDGFAIACAMGIVRSSADGESRAARRSEWAGLLYAVALSVAGNIAHALHALIALPLPLWLAIAFTSAPPVIVTVGLHLVARALERDRRARSQLETVHLSSSPARTEDDKTAREEDARSGDSPDVDAQPVDEPVDEPVHVPVGVAEPVVLPPHLRPVRTPPSREEARREWARTGRTWTGAEVGQRLGVSDSQGRRVLADWRREDEDQVERDTATG